MTIIPPHLHKDLPPLPRPDREPRAGECPHITHYIPFGRPIVAVACGKPAGHDDDPDRLVRRHRAVFVEADLRETVFEWPRDDEISAEDAR